MVHWNILYVSWAELSWLLSNIKGLHDALSSLYTKTILKYLEILYKLCELWGGLESLGDH
jgi:hypothetical protein